jgi:hypothetical protein
MDWERERETFKWVLACVCCLLIGEVLGTSAVPTKDNVAHTTQSKKRSTLFKKTLQDIGWEAHQPKQVVRSQAAIISHSNKSASTYRMHCDAVSQVLQPPASVVLPPSLRRTTPIRFCDSKGGRLGNQLFAYAAAYGASMAAGGLPLVRGRHADYVCETFPKASGCRNSSAGLALDAGSASPLQHVASARKQEANLPPSAGFMSPPIVHHIEDGSWRPTAWWPLQPTAEHVLDGYRQM